MNSLEKLNKSNLLANYSFALLFPGFFIYNFMIAKNYIPPFLGGYFGLISSILFPLILIAYIGNLKKIVMLELVYLLILLYSISITIINFYFNQPTNLTEEMFFWSISGIIINYILFYIGTNIKVSMNFLAIISFLFLIMFTMVVFNISENGMFYLKQEASENNEFISSYQGFGRSLLFTSLFLIAFLFNNKKVVYLIFLMSCVSLFFNGARTEFVLLLAPLFIFLAIKNLFINTNKALISIFLFIIFMAIAAVVIDYLPKNRIFQLADIFSSSSGMVRMELLNYSIKLVENSFIFGDYGGYTAKEYSLGSYPHNIFSAWVNLGLFGFLLYIGLLFYIIILLLKNLNRINLYNSYYILFSLCSIATIIALLFAKQYNYMLLGFTVGVGINFLKHRRERDAK